MLKLKNIKKVYKTENENVEALKGIDIEFRESEFVAILGQSGCGKTTLLNIIGGLDRYTGGDLIIDGKSTKEYKDRDWDSYRNYSVGFVFQSYNLIGHQSILANVELALTISGYSKKDKKAKAIEALTKVGLGDKIHKKPNQLSGGQMQRVAIARAIVNNPDIILADEPTGALDSKTSVQIMDILKEIAKEKLVIMVTHNPELAKEYATRIVELKDGKITSDTNPINTENIEYRNEKVKKTKLSFFTALGLSLNNLMTKKSRTILTAFAGAIGIIGIALILSLSNGVNEYIDSVESDTMGSYPIELEKETIDLSSIMQNSKNNHMKEIEENISGESANDDRIYSSNKIEDSLENSKATTAKNNLGKFKKYLEDNKDSISNSVSVIEYGYNVSPIALRLNNKDVVKVSPSYLSDYTSEKNKIMDNSFMKNMNTATSSVWTQLISDETLMKNQYDLLSGKYPTEENEVALIVSKNNELSDFILYTLGLMDYDEMLNMIEAIEDDKVYESKEQDFKYSDILEREYEIFAPCEMYKKTKNAWVDKSKDEEYLKSILGKGLKVKITGILKATEDSNILSGIAYTSKLTKYLMNKTKDSDIVKQQLEEPDVNVLTGKKFEEKDSKKTSSVKINTEFATLNNNYDILKTSTNNKAGVSVKLLSDINLNGITNNITNGIIDNNISNTIDNQINQQPNTEIEYAIKFINYDNSVIYEGKFKQDADLTSLKFESPTKLSSEPNIINLFIGWKSSEGKYYLTSELPNVTKDETYTALFYQYVLNSSNIPNMNGTNNGNTGMPANIPNFNMNGFNANSGSIPPNFNGFDMSALNSLKGGGSTELSNDQLLVMMAGLNEKTPSTYDEVLEALGYITEDEPSSISLYPTNFDGKEVVQKFIDQYNNQVEDEKDKVTYNDIIGTITSSVTSIVNMISYVLIAFVSISLVVSSIMIAIITYISVLERTKEIGVLRALGASKKGVSKIFNAETFIEGFISGLIGIGVTLLLCIPINKIVYGLTEVDNIASLPMEYSFILIIISIVLTVIAGIIPSRAASKKDPAVVLRSE